MPAIRFNVITPAAGSQPLIALNKSESDEISLWSAIRAEMNLQMKVDAPTA